MVGSRPPIQQSQPLFSPLSWRAHGGPGVLVIQNNPDDATARSLIMRLGSEVNSRNAVPFDGGYTVLRVRLVSPDPMLGSWASGTVTEVAAGFFCAVRQSNNL